MLFVQLFDVLVTNVKDTIINGDWQTLLPSFIMADVIAIGMSVG